MGPLDGQQFLEQGARGKGGADLGNRVGEVGLVVIAHGGGAVQGRAGDQGDAGGGGQLVKRRQYLALRRDQVAAQADEYLLLPHFFFPLSGEGPVSASTSSI